MWMGTGRRPFGRPRGRGRDPTGLAPPSRSRGWTPWGQRRLHRRRAPDGLRRRDHGQGVGAELPAGRGPRGTGVTSRAGGWTSRGRHRLHRRRAPDKQLAPGRERDGGGVARRPRGSASRPVCRHRGRGIADKARGGGGRPLTRLTRKRTRGREGGR